MMTESLRARLCDHFAPRNWRSYLDQFQYSGYSLVPVIRGLNPRFVVDVGCGYSEFKKQIPNLIGIDLVNPAADLVCDLMEAPIRDHSIDVILALGSVNFGPRQLIEAQLRTLASWLTPDGTIFMRGNPGQSIGDGIEIFPWNAQTIVELAAAVGLAVVSQIREEQIVHPTAGPGLRLVWTLRRSGRCIASAGACGES